MDDPASLKGRQCLSVRMEACTDLTCLGSASHVERPPGFYEFTIGNATGRHNDNRRNEQMVLS